MPTTVSIVTICQHTKILQYYRLYSPSCTFILEINWKFTPLYPPLPFHLLPHTPPCVNYFFSIFVLHLPQQIISYWFSVHPTFCCINKPEQMYIFSFKKPHNWKHIVYIVMNFDFFFSLSNVSWSSFLISISRASFFCFTQYTIPLYRFSFICLMNLD